MGRQNTASSGYGANLRLPPSPSPLLKRVFLCLALGVVLGVAKDDHSRGDASEFLPFDDAASDTTDHFVGLVAQSADG